MAKVTVLATALIFALSVQLGETLRCWSCSSDINSHCSEPFTPQLGEINMLDCDRSAGPLPYKSVCRKVTRHVNGELVIIRGCAWKAPDDNSNTCPTGSNARFVSSTCETCNNDGCNGNNTIATTTPKQENWTETY